MNLIRAQRIARVFLLVSFFAVTSHAAAQSQTVTTGSDGATYVVFDAPNSSSTIVTGMNNAGDVIGYFKDALSNTTRGFVRDHKGNTTVFDASANASETMPVGINDVGDIAGFLFDTSGACCFLRDARGRLTVFDAPQPFPRVHETGHAMAIDNSDHIAGYIRCVGCDTWTGFVRDQQGNMTTFAPIIHGSVPTGINEPGEITGATSPFWSAEDGFVRDQNGGMTVFDIGNGPGPKAHPVGINNQGDITGYYYDSKSGRTLGFLRNSSGNITPFGATADASQTRPAGMNASDEIVGDFTDSTGPHNFFVDALGTVTVFDVPNNVGAHAISINNGGDVAGYFFTDVPTFATHGFVRIASASN